MPDKTSLSIVMACFNALPLCQRSIEAALQHTDSNFELIIINNANPNPGVREFLDKIEDENQDTVSVYNLKENIGCHGAYNLGFAYTSGDYMCKLDDDTVVPEGWDSRLISLLQDNPNFAYICARNANIGHTIEATVVGTSGKVWNILAPDSTEHYFVGFSCMMMPRNTYKEFGDFTGNGFYGGEEHKYGQLALKANRNIGYLNEGEHINHLDNKDRDPDYVLWKYVHGYLRTTKLDFVDFKKDKQAIIEGYQGWLTMSGWHVETAHKRLGELFLK